MQYAKIKASEFDKAYDLFKSYMSPVIQQAIGWDEEFQRTGFTNNYRPEWLHWVCSDGKKLGLLCIREKSECLHIHLVIVFEQFQGTGKGYDILSDLQKQANDKPQPITLSSFKCNERAIKFYKSMGFGVVSEDEHFYSFKWEPIAS